MATALPYGTTLKMPKSPYDVAPRERTRYVPPPLAGIQISLRLPRATLAKLNRLARSQIQTKSQFITKLIARISEEELLALGKLAPRTLAEALRPDEEEEAS